MYRMSVVLAAVVMLSSCSSSPGGVAEPSSAASALTTVRPVGETESVANDPDDPAIWVHATDAQRSLILGTDKIEGKGALYVFGIDGAIRQTIGPLDRPNNVDVEYDVAFDGRRIDIAVLTERKQHRLRAYEIPSDGGMLKEISSDGGIPVLSGQAGEAAEPMGIALYRRPSDQALFAIVAPKTGGTTDYLWQYRLEGSGHGQLTGTFVRRFGAFSQLGAEPGEIGEIEAVAVDDELGYVYYSDERFGVRKYHADPAAADAGRELAAFGRTGFPLDREGIALYTNPDGTGYIIVSDQRPNGTVLHLFRREGRPGAPHDHEEIGAVPTTADETDGLDATSQPVPGFPRGLVVAMNSGPRNFVMFRWEDVSSGTAAQR